MVITYKASIIGAVAVFLGCSLATNPGPAVDPSEDAKAGSHSGEAGRRRPAGVAAGRRRAAVPTDADTMVSDAPQRAPEASQEALFDAGRPETAADRGLAVDAEKRPSDAEYESAADSRVRGAETPDSSVETAAAVDASTFPDVDQTVVDASTDAKQEDAGISPVCGNGIVETGETCDGQYCIRCKYPICEWFRNVDDWNVTSAKELADLGAFLRPECPALEGNLILRVSTTTFTRLSYLRAIGGRLYISVSSGLQIFDGLQNVEYVGGDFYVSTNTSLIDFSDFSSLYYVGGDFMLIGSQSTLTAINGFDMLRVVMGGLEVRDFQMLTQINGFRQLIDVRGHFIIEGNPALKQINGFERLRKVGVNFSIVGNDNLQTLGALDGSNIGFDDLESIFSTYAVTDNPLLSTCEVYELRDRVSVGGETKVYDNYDDTADCQ